MAHKIEVPIELVCNIPRCNWIVGKARPVAWWNDCEPARLDLEVVSPERFQGAKDWFSTSELSDEILSRLPLGKLRHSVGAERYEVALRRTNPDVPWNALPEEMREMELDVVLCEETNDGKAKGTFDPWAIRTEFLKVNGAVDSLFKFLERQGRWQQAANPMGSADSISVYLPSCFWKDQTLIRDGLLDRAAWLSSKASYLHLTPRSEFPHLFCTASTSFAAIRATVTIDAWRNTKFRQCARVDCNQIFERQSRHKKIFCDQYCGHIVSVRRVRAKARKPVGRPKGGNPR